MNPHERQTWMDQERAAPSISDLQRGQIIANGALAEGRSVVAMLLSLRREIPIETACVLLALAPVGLALEASKAWVGAVAYSEDMERPQ